MQRVRLVAVTPGAEKIMAYCARVSNPANQASEQIEGLLRYCVRHGHWSVFEQANLVLEIQTSRAISPQILRHRSFSFQEFSQRYAAPDFFIPASARRQDAQNRQNSIDDLSKETRDWFAQTQASLWESAHAAYQSALARGIAKECARVLLPLGTGTRLYMNGTVRSWIHYIQLRADTSTQLEHREIARACRDLFCTELPTVARALGWEKGMDAGQGRAEG